MPSHSEQKRLERPKMLAYLEALRDMVQVNLDAGADEDFEHYSIASNRMHEAANAFNAASIEWHPWWYGIRSNGGFPSLLRVVESYVKDQPKDPIQDEPNAEE